jgi:hypothetical protein
VRPLAARTHNAALVAAALLISVYVSFSVSGTGDYPGDAGPALTALIHGELHAFGQARPAMGDLSLLLRAPFAALAYLGHPSELAVYRWGSLPCVISVAVLALWLARIAAARGTGPLGQWAIVLVSLINPTVSSALSLGHPEELLTASLCIGALVAALTARTVLCLVLLGLALACKQWSVVMILPVLLALERDRIRTLLGALALAVILTIPEAAAAPLGFVRNQLALTHYTGRNPPPESWLWPLTSRTTIHVAVEGAEVPLTKHRLPLALAQSLHTLMILLTVLLSAVFARLRGLPLRRDDALSLTAAVLLIRCSVDVETMTYYYVTFLLGLLAWDALRGERIPVRALIGSAAVYLLLDRLPPEYGTLGLSSLLSAACTIPAIVYFLRPLLGSRSASPGRPKPRRPVLA